MAIETLTQVFHRAALGDRADCLVYRRADRWHLLSTRRLVENVGKLASALSALGIGKGDRVGLMADNGPHWPTVDFAVLQLGAVLVPIYPTLPGDQAAYIAKDCSARVLFVQGRERLATLAAQRAGLPELEQLIWIPGPSEMPPGEVPPSEVPSDEPMLQPSTDEHLDEHPASSSLDALLNSTDGWNLERLAELSQAIQPDDLATLIYTSGTTGHPKGVMLTHRNIASNVEASLEILEMDSNCKALSFLPLSHSFERTVDYTYFARGMSIAYAESVQTVARDLLEIEPHCFVSVPRVYEKILSSVRARLAQSAPAKRRLFAWAESIGRRAVPYRLQRQSPPGLLGAQLKLADRLVFQKLRAALGRRFLFATSGGAPLAPEVAEFFWGAGIEIYEGYGLSETAPVLTTNRPGAVKLGTVGQAIPGVELAIRSDGEIAARGPNIMRGYLNLQQATDEVLLADGWFLTGDIGEIDADGYLKITDRKKEILVNAYGKNVAPAPIENRIKASRYIEQAVVLGDRRKFLAALLVPHFEAVRAEFGSAINALDNHQLVTEPQVVDLIATEIEVMNSDLAGYEQIKRWHLLPEEFSIESDELTPTQKVKRRVIKQRHHETIEAMYAGG